MANQRRTFLLFALLILVAVVVAIYFFQNRNTGDPQVIEETVVAEKVATQEIPGVVERPATPSPAVSDHKSIVICLSEEPDTLYEYSGNTQTADYVKSVLGYGRYSFLTRADFDYQPVALEDLPTVDNGGVVLEKITINPGDTIAYVDPATGDIITDTTALDAPIELNQFAMTFKIQPGLKWEDGTPITAADYELSFKLSLEPSSPSSIRLVGERTAEFVMLDDNTQQVKLLPGFLPADYVQIMWDPMPAHILGGMAITDIPNSDFARHPLSFGPFKMAEWVAGQSIRVVKNDAYWREDYPQLDEVTFKFVSTPDQLLAQLSSGACDVVTEDSLTVEQIPLLDQAAAQGLLVPYYERNTIWEHIDFGMTSVDGRYQFFGPLGYTDLGDLNSADPASWVDSPAWAAAKTVRKAFAACIDRQRMADEALAGHSSVIHSIVPENHPMWPTEGLVQYEYNPDLGKELLALAGWTETDGDGFVDRNGIKFQITLNTTTDNPMRETIARRVQEDLRVCGVDVVIDQLPSSELLGDGPDGVLFGRSFDLGEFAWLFSVEPMAYIYYCEQWPSPENAWAGSNDPGYCNPAYDTFAQEAETTLNRGEQKALYAQALAILSEDLPVLPLFQRVSVSATRPGVLNYKPNATIDSPMWNIWEWDIE